MVPRNEVYAVIDGERAYQEAQKQGDTWRDGKTVEQTPGDFLSYMQIYMGQAAKAQYDGDEQALLATVRKVTALGVACMEKFGAPPR